MIEGQGWARWFINNYHGLIYLYVVPSRVNDHILELHQAQVDSGPASLLDQRLSHALVVAGRRTVFVGQTSAYHNSGRGFGWGIAQENGTERRGLGLLCARAFSRRHTCDWITLVRYRWLISGKCVHRTRTSFVLLLSPPLKRYEVCSALRT